MFTQIKSNPILKSIEPLSKNLTEISTTLISILESEKLQTKDYQKIKSQFIAIKTPVVDVEFASLNSFQQLIEHYSEKNNIKINLNNTLIQK